VAAFSSAPPTFLLPTMASQAFITAASHSPYRGPIGMGQPHGMWYPNSYPAMPTASAMQMQAIAGRPYSSTASPIVTSQTSQHVSNSCGRSSSRISEAGALEQDLRALHLPQSLTPSTPQPAQNVPLSRRCAGVNPEVIPCALLHGPRQWNMSLRKFLPPRIKKMMCASSAVAGGTHLYLGSKVQEVRR
jgi:hypothetical protein